MFVDVAKIRVIDPPTALVLAAELDRWRQSARRKPRPLDQSWHPPVRRLFRQAGLFELLGTAPESADDESVDEELLEVLPFVRGYSVAGEIGSKLRDRLEQTCGKSIGPRMAVYDAIAEAIANTRHAYPKGTPIWPIKLSGRWWASGSWRKADNTVTLHLYDQGVGIPATLPRSDHWSDMLRLPILEAEARRFTGRLHPEYTDHSLLQAALVVGRTSTGQIGRGKGLAEMAAWIDKLENGVLRVTSGRGVVTYRPGGVVAGEHRAAPFVGTLIEWEIGLGD